MAQSAQISLPSSPFDRGRIPLKPLARRPFWPLQRVCLHSEARPLWPAHPRCRARPWRLPVYTDWQLRRWATAYHAGNRITQAVTSLLKKQCACWRTVFLCHYISYSSHISNLLGNATLTSPPQAVRDWSYAANSFVGDGYILVGDAACFIDPLFSSGVHLAMNAGLLASAYVNTLFTDSTLALESRVIYTKLYNLQYKGINE